MPATGVAGIGRLCLAGEGGGALPFDEVQQGHQNDEYHCIRLRRLRKLAKTPNQRAALRGAAARAMSGEIRHLAGERAAREVKRGAVPFVGLKWACINAANHDGGLRPATLRWYIEFLWKYRPGHAYCGSALAIGAAVGLGESTTERAVAELVGRGHIVRLSKRRLCVRIIEDHLPIRMRCIGAQGELPFAPTRPRQLDRYLSKVQRAMLKAHYAA